MPPSSSAFSRTAAERPPSAARRDRGHERQRRSLPTTATSTSHGVAPQGAVGQQEVGDELGNRGEHVAARRGAAADPACGLDQRRYRGFGDDVGDEGVGLELPRRRRDRGRPAACPSGWRARRDRIGSGRATRRCTRSPNAVAQPPDQGVAAGGIGVVQGQLGGPGIQQGQRDGRTGAAGAGLQGTRALGCSAGGTHRGHVRRAVDLVAVPGTVEVAPCDVDRAEEPGTVGEGGAVCGEPELVRHGGDQSADARRPAHACDQRVEVGRRLPAAARPRRCRHDRRRCG